MCDFFERLGLWIIPLVMLLTFGLVAAIEFAGRCEGAEKKVVRVGECNRWSGRCGVLFDDGSKSELHTPVVGEKVTVCK